MANTSYRAILFDLDGTLCPMELDEFLGGYFKDIARFAAEQGIDGEKFACAFGAGAVSYTHLTLPTTRHV